MAQAVLVVIALVIASGVTNGFWRNNKLESLQSIQAGLHNAAATLASASSVAVIGGGATGVSVSSNLKEQHPNKEVHFFYSQSQVLPGYHPKVKNRIEKQLIQQGVNLNPHHRAIIPKGRIRR